MIDVAKKHNRVVQIGTQQRSGPHYAAAKKLIHDGHIGKVVSVRMQSYRNIVPGFGQAADGPPPAGFDWNMFLGPAPERPYNPTYLPASFKGAPFRYRLWRLTNVLNPRHPQFAWVSLFGVALADLYVRLVATGVILDPRIV